MYIRYECKLVVIFFYAKYYCKYLRAADDCSFTRLKHFCPETMPKVINPKYYKHLKKGVHQKPFWQTKNGLLSVRLACTSSKTEILNKRGI